MKIGDILLNQGLVTQADIDGALERQRQDGGRAEQRHRLQEGDQRARDQRRQSERDRHPANVYVSPSTGIPVHPAAGHIDEEIAHEIGMPGPYDQGWMRANWMGHLVTNWAGDDAFVRKLAVRLSVPNLVGDLTWCRGVVTGKRTEDGEHLVDLSCWGETQRGERNTTATATVRYRLHRRARATRVSSTLSGGPGTRETASSSRRRRNSSAGTRRSRAGSPARPASSVRQPRQDARWRATATR